MNLGFTMMHRAYSLVAFLTDCLILILKNIKSMTTA
jgi:hypothetical protein